MIRITIAITLSTFLLAGCKCEVNLTGVVLDLYTNDPISGASVTGVGAETIDAITDSTGYFEFEELNGLDDCSSYQVKVNASGYSEKIVNISNGSHTEIRLDTIF